MNASKRIATESLIGLAAALVVQIPIFTYTVIVGFKNFGTFSAQEELKLANQLLWVSLAGGILIGAWVYQKRIKISNAYLLFISAALTALVAYVLAPLFLGDNNQILRLTEFISFGVFIGSILAFHRLADNGLLWAVSIICVVSLCAAIYLIANYERMSRSIQSGRNMSLAQSQDYQLYTLGPDSGFTLHSAGVYHANNEVAELGYNDGASQYLMLYQSDQLVNLVSVGTVTDLVSSARIPEARSGGIHGNTNSDGNYSWIATRVNDTYILIDSSGTESLTPSNVKKILKDLQPVTDNKLEALSK